MGNLIGPVGCYYHHPFTAQEAFIHRQNLVRGWQIDGGHAG